MMTSHLWAASVLRTKPVACGYQLYESPLPSLSASNSASRFSKPSPLSVENGMLFGSAQTRSTLGSTSSIDKSGRSTACANSFPDTNMAAIAVHDTHKLSRSHAPFAKFVISSRRRVRNLARPRQRSILMSETTVFRLGNRLGPVFALLRPSAWNCVISARPQIDEYLLHVAHDVRIGAERRHDALLRRVDVLAPVHHDIGEVGIVLRLQVIAERRGVT